MSDGGWTTKTRIGRMYSFPGAIRAFSQQSRHQAGIFKRWGESVTAPHLPLWGRANIRSLSGIGGFDRPAVIRAALGAHPVGQTHRAALWARDKAGSLQFPDGAAALIASCL